MTNDENQNLDDDPLRNGRYLTLSSIDLRMEMRNYRLLRKVHTKSLETWKKKNFWSKMFLRFTVAVSVTTYAYIAYLVVKKFLL